MPKWIGLSLWTAYLHVGERLDYGTERQKVQVDRSICPWTSAYSAGEPCSPATWTRMVFCRQVNAENNFVAAHYITYPRCAAFFGVLNVYKSSG